MNTDKSRQCEATILFGNDQWDIPCTPCKFHCQLPAGHTGPHAETGNLRGQLYAVTWTEEVAA